MERVVAMMMRGGRPVTGRRRRVVAGPGKVMCQLLPKGRLFAFSDVIPAAPRPWTEPDR